MKHIFLNLKRFDISPEKGGVNRLAPMKDWGRTIVSGTQDALTAYDPAEVEFVMYMPEAHLLGAAAAKTENSPVQLGCQGVYRADTAVGGNFGAFTTNRPANAAAQMGCASTLIGHCEERSDKAGLLEEAPIWSIGPGKTPADKPYITKIARFVKARTGGLDVVYGGGLKQDNAAMLASIDEIDGGLIALTRFSGEIGFYPDEYLDIIRRYLGK